MSAALKIVVVFLGLTACKPYAHGPVLTVREARDTFHPLIDFMEVTPGMTVADVGAGSGAFTVMMATQLENCLVYIQDIDSVILDPDNVDRIIHYYSEKTGHDLQQQNRFRIVYGTNTQSNLPNNSVDVIFMNAVAHVLDSPTAMFTDLGQKLRPDGKIYIRDGFRSPGNEYCTSKKCGMPLISIEELNKIMTSTGFRPYKMSDNMDGYPVLGFALARE